MCDCWTKSIRLFLLFAWLLPGFSSMMVRAQAPPLGVLPPAGTRRPANVPSNYVITPFGYFHPSCVLQLQRGEYMDKGGGLHLANGKTLQAGPCRYPHYMPSGQLAPGSGQSNDTVVEQDQEPSTQPAITHSWMEYSSATTGTAYGEGISTWTVPPVPIMQDGQVIYFFPGFEDYSTYQTIIQPVIGSYDGQAWTAASWNCCPAGTANESTPISINPGDTIVGTTKMTCAAGTTNCSTWNITTLDQTTSQSTELTNTPAEGQVFNWAQGGVLEVYYVNQCLDYPPNASIEFNTSLYDSNFNLISNPGWQNELVFPSTGQPQCDYGVTTSGSQTTLTYGTTSPSFGVGVTPADGIAVNQGGSATGTISITDINGFAGTVNVSASNLPTGVTAQITQGTSSNIYNITLTATSSAVLTGANTPATLTLTASGSGVATQNIPVNVIVNPPLTGGSGIVVNLANDFNLYSFYDDSQVYSITLTNSLDGAADVYSANQLSPPGVSPMALDLMGVKFDFGTPNQRNAVFGTGSNPISLPPGVFTGLQLLGAGINGSQESQSVVVTYTDNSTQTFTQNFDDWDSNSTSCSSSNPCTGGESVAVVTPYCDNYYEYPYLNRLFYLYDYSFALNSAKTVQSITLPSNQDVVVLAATLVGLEAPAVSVSPGSSSVSTTQQLSVTVTVSGGTSNPTPTGTVTLSGNSYTSPATALTSGSATINIPADTLAAGNYTFQASYSPDSNSSSTYTTSSGSASSQVMVTAVTPTVTVSPGTTSLTTTQPLSVTVSVNGGTGNPTPGGSVVLSGNSYTSPANTLTSGSAIINIPAGTLNAGDYIFQASFTPNGGSSGTYGSADGTASSSVTVSLTTPSITWTPATTIIYGSAGSNVLNASAGSVAGSFTYSATPSGGGSPINISGGTSTLAAGSYNIAANFTPNLSGIYSTNQSTASLVVSGESVWIVDSSGGISELAANGAGISSSADPGANLAVAIDGSGNLWTVGSGSTLLEETNQVGTSIATVPSGTGGLNSPSAIAVDGNGQIWVANGNNSVSHFSNAGAALSPATGYTDSSLSSPSGIAVDLSGSVWITNKGNNSVTRILGAAAPAAPLATAAANKTTGEKP